MSSSGKLAENGEGLRRRFKGATVTGGRLRGSRYADLSEAEIRKCASSYRGDPRFNQYCKQWVAVNTLALSEGFDETTSADMGDKAKGESATDVFGTNAKARCAQCSQKIFASCLKFAKNRKTAALIIVLLSFTLASRPAFLPLVSKLLILTLREAARRTFCIVTLIMDGILEEAVAQVDSALRGPPTSLPTQATQSSEAQNSEWWHWALHVLCLFLGARYGRVPGAVPPINRNPLG